jgi:hypothetical protein
MIEKRLDSPRAVHRHYWIPVAAAALLAVAVGLAWLSTAVVPPATRPTRPVHEEALLQRHVQSTAWKRGEAPPAAYPYRGDYDEALDAGTYISYSSKLTEGRDGPSAMVAGDGLPIPPRYLPAGSVPRRSEPLNPGVQAVYWTPLGELSVFETPERTGRAGIQTVIQDGREFKIARFVVKEIEVTLMSEGLPWPELDLIRKGLSNEPF